MRGFSKFYRLGKGDRKYREYRKYQNEPLWGAAQHCKGRRARDFSAFWYFQPLLPSREASHGSPDAPNLYFYIGNPHYMSAKAFCRPVPIGVAEFVRSYGVIFLEILEISKIPLWGAAQHCKGRPARALFDGFLCFNRDWKFLNPTDLAEKKIPTKKNIFFLKTGSLDLPGAF